MSKEKTMSEKHTCCALVIPPGPGSWRGFICTRSAKYERDGEWYCDTHDPEEAKAQRDAQDAKWKAQSAERKAAKTKEDEMHWRASMFDDFVETLRSILALQFSFEARSTILAKTEALANNMLAKIIERRESDEQ
jgi:uncharacterized Zn finger protein (UPF0148 family)